VPSSGKVTLYKDSGRGSGDSLYRESDSYEEVDATRLSDWLLRRNIILQRGICLLRMNIEGAEYDVIKDLVESGLARNIDGYYGMWDDVFKIDQQRDEAFSCLSDSESDPSMHIQWTRHAMVVAAPMDRVRHQHLCSCKPAQVR
jgi:hypothetical protein